MHSLESRRIGVNQQCRRRVTKEGILKLLEENAVLEVYREGITRLFEDGRGTEVTLERILELFKGDIALPEYDVHGLYEYYDFPDQPEEAHILKLPGEVLTEIFKWNTNIFEEDNCFSNTRSASQVCRTFRSTVLHLPFIWGRLFELQHYDELWRRELLRRSAGAPLWVKGSVSSPYDSRLGFFYSILHNWPAIEHFRVKVVDARSLSKGDWNVLRRPTTSLRSLSIEWKAQEYPLALFTNGTIPLLPDIFPFLQGLTIRGPLLHISPLRMPALRRLDISLPSTLPQILRALKFKTKLEYLSLRVVPLHQGSTATADADQFPDLQTVNLPELTYLRIAHPSPSAVVDLLDHIRPRDGCSLHICTELRRMHLEQTKRSFASLLTYIQPYLTRCLQGSPYHQVFVSVDGGEFHLRCTPFTIASACKRPSLDLDLLDSVLAFSITLKLEEIEADMLINEHAACLLSNFEFPAAQKLSLNLSGWNTSETLDAYYPAAPFFTSLASVKYLQLTQRDIRFVLFPQLETLSLTSLTPLEWVQSNQGTDKSDRKDRRRNLLLRFLQRRKKSGYSISHLVVTASIWDDDGFQDGLNYLDEEVTGLVIQWDNGHKNFEYICGLGD
ncbi:hypothetical protein CVT26_016135 [Gymnopilus dilepis]|uniref:F-box domain-containing protein n=1 Tax=Gymnopilus dilepis TaxID=231916 RepID=A0A409XYX1_9AGAR|nr:hypothetical protein CVT26_016135 [Gymnopilus dilepis]